MDVQKSKILHHGLALMPKTSPKRRTTIVNFMLCAWKKSLRHTKLGFNPSSEFIPNQLAVGRQLSSKSTLEIS